MKSRPAEKNIKSFLLTNFGVDPLVGFFVFAKIKQYLILLIDNRVPLQRDEGEDENFVLIALVNKIYKGKDFRKGGNTYGQELYRWHRFNGSFHSRI